MAEEKKQWLRELLVCNRTRVWITVLVLDSSAAVPQGPESVSSPDFLRNWSTGSKMGTHTNKNIEKRLFVGIFYFPQ